MRLAQYCGALAASLLLLSVLTPGSASIVLPAEYSPLGNDKDIWFVNVSVGTPPQRLPVQIDTGSSDLLIYDIDCKDCKTEHAFDHTKSKTFARIKCDDELCGGSHRDKLCTPCDKKSHYCLVDDSYVDGSFVAGTVSQDKVSFLGLEAQWTFGLVTNESKGFLPHSFSGIWGLAFAPESCWWQDSAVFGLLENSSLPNSVSLCLMEHDGFLELGENFTDTAVPYEWTPLFNRSWWSFTLDAVALGDVTLNLSVNALNMYQSIFDSGWQGFGLNDETYDAIMVAISDLCNQSNNSIPFLCNGSIIKQHQHLTKEQLALYPNITFTLAGGVRVLMTPDMYMLKSHKTHEHNMYKWGLSKSGKDVGTTFGTELLKRNRIALDVTGGRIGIVSALNTPWCQ